MAFTKLFNTIITSTIWQEDSDTKVVWITMLAMADKDGEVAGTLPGLARLAGVSMEATKAALHKFLSPDEHSRTKDDEGRRIEEIDGGWRLLNHAKYRRMASVDEQIEKNRERQRRYKERRRAAGDISGNGGNGSVTIGDAKTIEAEAEANTKAEKTGEKKLSSSRDDQPALELQMTPHKPIPQQAVDLWNDVADANGWPKVQNLKSPARRSSLAARLAECGGIDGWRAAIAKASKSDFLCGRTGRGEGHENWRFDFDDMIKAKFFTRIMEGKYDGNGAAKTGLAAMREGMRRAVEEPRTWEQQMEDMHYGERDRTGEDATVVEGTYEASARG